MTITKLEQKLIAAADAYNALCAAHQAIFSYVSPFYDDLSLDERQALYKESDHLFDRAESLKPQIIKLAQDVENATPKLDRDGTYNIYDSPVTTIHTALIIAQGARDKRDTPGYGDF